jgi:hypothetical protein
MALERRFAYTRAIQRDDVNRVQALHGQQLYGNGPFCQRPSYAINSLNAFRNRVL